MSPFLIVCDLDVRGRAVLQLSWTYVKHRERFSFLTVTTFFVKILSCILIYMLGKSSGQVVSLGSCSGTHPASLSLVFAVTSDSFSFECLHRLSSSSSKKNI